MLLRTPWYLRDHITNKEVKTRTVNTIGLYEDLLTSVKRQTEVVRACYTIIWTGQDCPTGNSSRRETKRQTEETMGRQHQRVDWPWIWNIILRNSSVSSVWARCLAQCSVVGSILPWSEVEGIFRLELTWVLTPFPKTLLDESINQGLVCAHMHSIAWTSKILV